MLTVAYMGIWFNTFARDLTNGTILSMIPKPKEMLTNGQVARVCGVAPRTSAKWIDKGLFPGSYKIPRSAHRRVPAAALREFMRAEGMPQSFFDELDALTEGK